MANIAITSQCNLNCSYCFTQSEYKARSPAVLHMSLKVYQQALDFVARSDIKQIRILGGEPTLHPDFIPYLERALKTECSIRLFSNGLIPEKVLNFLQKVPKEKINIVLNITQVAEQSTKIQPRLEKTLKQLNQKISLGFNIFKKNIEFNFLLDLIRIYNLKKSVRLGLAHPCIGYKNQYLLPKHYFHTGGKIINFARKAQEQSVKINLDCGFVPCMFGNEDLKQIGLDTSLGLHCEPIPDILPDGSIVPCYSLSAVSRMKINSTMSADSLRKQFMQRILQYSNSGIFKTCSLCDYRHKGLCSGGCTAQKIMRSNSVEKTTIKIK